MTNKHTEDELDRLKEINAELLEALRIALSYYDRPEFWMRVARSAISKAIG